MHETLVLRSAQEKITQAQRNLDQAHAHRKHLDEICASAQEKRKGTLAIKVAESAKNATHADLEHITAQLTPSTSQARLVSSYSTTLPELYDNAPAPPNPSVSL